MGTEKYNKKLIDHYWKLVQIEDNRWKDIQDKSNSLIAVLGFLLTSFTIISILNFEGIKEYINLIISGYFFCFTAIIFDILFIFPKKKKTIPFENDKISSIIGDDVAIMGSYLVVAELNKNMNDRAFILIMIMSVITLITVILFSILFFLLITQFNAL